MKEKKGEENSAEEVVNKNLKKSKEKVFEGKPLFVKEKIKKIDPDKFPSLLLKTEHEIALDFATKICKKFDKAIKAVVLFGSIVKKTAVAGSDIDLIIIIDDLTIKWDQEMIAWYRTELEKILRINPYKKELHINTIKVSTWWEDLLRGDPVVINILRYGKTLIDIAGFFEPLQFLLQTGKIRSTPESVYNLLQRAPTHFTRSKISELNCIEGLYWAMVDSSQAALIAADCLPPSPEHIPASLIETFVSSEKLKQKYVDWFRELHSLHKKISHGEITELKGILIDTWQEKTKEFMNVMVELVDELIK